MRNFIGLLSIILLSCSTLGCASRASNADSSSEADQASAISVPAFNADSAFSYVRRQVELGPRVPNTPAHHDAADYLASQLKAHGAKVTVQEANLKAFDGTKLLAKNIMGQYNPEAEDRLLLLAHWDTRPWADEDPNPANRQSPADGANDGASGVGVLLEVARALGAQNSGKGIDILFVDAEDWGESSNDESWALGAKYFANHPILPGYLPSRAILLDMVGGVNAKFYHEFFSLQSAPELCQAVWSAAGEAGFGERFVNRQGSAVTDDHIQLIKVGIPSIDIIEYNPGSGFNPTWHTKADNLDNISKETLQAVGQTLLQYIYK